MKCDSQMTVLNNWENKEECMENIEHWKKQMWERNVEFNFEMLNKQSNMQF